MSPPKRPAARLTRRLDGERRATPDDEDARIPSSDERERRNLEIHNRINRDNFPPIVYDTLPQVYLTRRALRELDRRNCLKSRPTSTANKAGFLTSDLSRFARRGGPDLSRLRNYSDPENMAPGAVSPPRAPRDAAADGKSPESRSKMKKSSAYDDHFESTLLDHDIFMELHEFPNDRMAPEPVNLEEVLKFISRTRDSPSADDFSKADFLNFKRTNNATGEGTVMVNVIPAIIGPPAAGNECGVIFTNFGRGSLVRLLVSARSEPS